MRTPSPTTSLAGDSWDSSPPSAAPAAGGWGIPRSRPVHSVGCGRNPAGGVVEVAMVSVARWGSARFPFCGGAPRSSDVARAAFGGRGSPDLAVSSGSSSSLPAGGEVDLQAVELRWRTRRLELRARRASRLPPALGMKTVAARWWCWSGRVLAVLVHRHKLRRCAADGLCGDLQGRRCPRAVVRRRSAVFVFFAGDVAGA